ncbi:MAG: phosphatidylserine/phosphatidylglycerophosphate/cardiolipin synthase family protein [Chitinophagales bacterium]|nr:phosphatidylserine/phosphatidylglycerophosphate/cardiolipin synthase family protein [Bacteroidota bacterium]MCB9044436.1 phosphatidylserine/phosphatidylglycerophosphate/cardiolipin synthase family protein [Chitinophagales bacterium]
MSNVLGKVEFMGFIRNIILSVLFFFMGTCSIFAQNIYHILNSEEDALQCRIDLIQQAQNEILLSYYIFEPDLVGTQLLTLLLEAAERGIKICILVDDMGNTFSRQYAQYLYEKGIEIRVYNEPNFPKINTFTHRLHDKIFLTDAQRMIIGGRNIKNAYYNLAERNFMDRDVLVQQKASVDSARAHFYTLWNNSSITTWKKRELLTEEDRATLLENIEANLAEFARLNTYHFDTQNDWSEGQKNIPNIRFWHNQFKQEGRQKSNMITDSLLYLVRNAQENITIQNPYFAPTHAWRKAFKEALSRGVKVKVMTNSVATNDVLLMQGAYRNMRKRLLKLGIRLWEFKGPKMVHMKTMVIDDSISVIGSYNIHAVSQNWNTEVAAVAFDKDAAAQHLAFMQPQFDNAVYILPEKNRPETKIEAPLCYKFRMTFDRFTLSFLLKHFL